MNFISILYPSFFILPYFNIVTAETNPELLISGNGADAITPCGIGLTFFIELNNTSVKHDYEVQVSADQCCLEAGGSLDCDVLEIIGDCVGFIPRSAIKTVRMVAPILDPIDRRGYCILYLDSKCNYNGRNMRDTVKINFDTRIENVKKILQANIKPCKNIDEDPLNDCKPVDCDIYYNTQKSHYNTRLKRCVEVPKCMSDLKSELPNSIYDPVSNRCIDGKSIKKRDIDNVKEINRNNRRPKDVLIINKFNNEDDSNATNTDLNDALDKVPMCKKCNKLHILHPPNMTERYKQCYISFLMNYIRNNKCTVTLLGGVIFVQCCIMVGMIYCFSKSCICCKDKNAVKKIFNYRQDASVTTPLIGTSNMDTETDYQFESEHSNIDKKIKCYKACEKEKNNKCKMTDDILSNCLCRRNWSTKQTKLEAPSKVIETRINIDNVEVDNRIQPVPADTKVVLEDEKQRASEKLITKRGSLSRCLTKDIIDREKEDIEAYDTSEREIQCHSYNNDSNNLTGFKPGSGSKNLGFFNTENRTISVCMGKGAQAHFSNDSLDEMLSGKGLYFVEDLSKYDLSNEAHAKTSSSIPVSSKTSKNNFKKTFLSILHINKSRPNTSSDPGGKLAQDPSNLKLLHMSQASLYSTSNDSACVKPKESRSLM